MLGYRFVPEGKGPLYRRLAARLAFEIATGRRKPGTRLPSLRRAQALWGVSMHTVRRAYAALRTRGLVSVRHRGETRIDLHASEARSSLRECAAHFLAEANRRFGATPLEAAGVIGELDRQPATVVVAECSRTLSERIASQIADTWDVEVIPRVLRDLRPCEETVISTLFHEKELRHRRALSSLATHVVRIGFAPSMIGELRSRLLGHGPQELLLCETDAELATILAVELRAAVGGAVKVLTGTLADLRNASNRRHHAEVKLASPGCWDMLSPARRRRGDVVLLDYVVDAEDLNLLGQRLGWKRRIPNAPPMQHSSRAVMRRQ